MSPSVVPSAPAGGYAGFTVTLSADPYGSRAFAAVVSLRQRLDRSVPG
jgi:hypothetical protein